MKLWQYWLLLFVFFVSQLIIAFSLRLTIEDETFEMLNEISYQIACQLEPKTCEE